MKFLIPQLFIKYYEPQNMADRQEPTYISSMMIWIERGRKSRKPILSAWFTDDNDDDDDHCPSKSDSFSFTISFFNDISTFVGYLLLSLSKKQQ